MDWEIKEKIKEKLEQEKGYTIKHGAKYNFALAYPNLYRVGMSNLGIHVVYSLLNREKDTFCQRFFLPEASERERHIKTHTPLLSMETQTPMGDFDILGFAVSFEMDYFHILEMLEISKIPALRTSRDEEMPLLIAGGPCATFNPEPLANFFDAFIIGEGEAVLPGFMEAFIKSREEAVSRQELLLRLASLPGIYVPSLYKIRMGKNGTVTGIEPLPGAPKKVKRQWVKDFEEVGSHTVIITEDNHFDLYLLETARGCGRHCRFCMAGYAFRPPRNTDIKKLLSNAKEARSYGKRLGLMGAAISDHPEINRLCQGILDMGLDMSVASFRADSVTEELVAALKKSGIKTLTLAPEAGSKKMRSIINKGIEEEHLFHALQIGARNGILNYRLYIMIGLPFEEEGDISAIGDLALKLKERLDTFSSRGTITLSINPFVPKPFTPFMWVPMADKRYIEGAISSIKKMLKRTPGIKIIAESPREALVQGVLARGNRDVGDALYLAHTKGGKKAFKTALKEKNLSEKDLLFRTRDKDEIFPWDMLDLGVRREYLWQEFQKAQKFEHSSKCFDGCSCCGVCKGYGEG